MKNYIKYRIKQIELAPLEVQKRTLENLYKELEERGYNHLEIYTMINEVIINNLKGLNNRLKNLLKNEKEEK